MTHQETGDRAGRGEFQVSEESKLQGKAIKAIRKLNQAQWLVQEQSELTIVDECLAESGVKEKGSSEEQQETVRTSEDQRGAVRSSETVTGVETACS